MGKPSQRKNRTPSLRAYGSPGRAWTDAGLSALIEDRHVSPRTHARIARTARRSAHRVFYVFDPRRCVIFLIGRDKKGNDRFYEQVVPSADTLRSASEGTRSRNAGLTMARKWRELYDKLPKERRKVIESRVEELERELRSA